MFFQLSLSNSKSPQVSRTLLSILTDLNNVVVWIVSIYPLIFNSFSSLPKLLGTVPSAPITIGITIILMFLTFLSSLEMPKYLFLSSLFSFSLCGRLKWQNPYGDSFLTQNPRGFYASYSLEWILVLCKYHLVVWSNFNLLHNSPHGVV